MLNLLNFIKKILPSFEKNELLVNFEISLKEIETVKNTYSNINNVLKTFKFNSPENKDIIEKFYKELKKEKVDVKLSNNKNIGEDVYNMFVNIEINGKELYNLFDKDLNDIIISEAISNKKAILLRSVAHYEFMTSFAIKLANYLYINEVEHTGIELESNYKLNKKQIEYIQKNLWIFARLLSNYSRKNNTFMKELESIEDIVIMKDKTEEIESLFSSSKIDIFDDLPSGFIGSPIYTLRLAIATWQAERYMRLKEEKKLLELRYLHFKMLKETGNSDPSIEKEIGYIQKKITDIDYKISKMEDSVND